MGICKEATVLSGFIGSACGDSDFGTEAEAVAIREIAGTVLKNRGTPVSPGAPLKDAGPDVLCLFFEKGSVADSGSLLVVTANGDNDGSHAIFINEKDARLVVMSCIRWLAESRGDLMAAGLLYPAIVLAGHLSQNDDSQQVVATKVATVLHTMLEQMTDRSVKGSVLEVLQSSVAARDRRHA